MDLRSKLGLYKEGIGKSQAGPANPHHREVDKLVPGRIVTNDDGSCYVIENRYPLEHTHGSGCLGEALNVAEDILSSLDGGNWGGLGAGDLMFLDTETTGLSGGAGTVAFLVGVGFFEEGTYLVRQYFMRDYDEEAAMLYELQQLFSKRKGFVTFNGKSFDINLLQSRFISNRLKPAFRELPHLDLLYPSRKVWGLKLENCRLSSLEENVLEEYRSDDIPGAQIPAVYFKYLDDRDAGDIKRVIRHNELDILSMVSLLARLSAMLQSPMSQTDGGYELLGLGRIFEANGKTDSMLECFEACTGSEHYAIRSQAVKRLTGEYKRSGNYDRALEHWKAMESENTGFELFHLVEMAKYYEHKAKDFEFALILTEKALQNCHHAGMSGDRRVDELRKRRERLRRKSEAIKMSKGS